MKFPILFLLAALSTSATAPTPLTRKDIFSRVLPSLVSLTFDGDDGKTKVCTGFIVDAARGWIITAKHCVPPDRPLYINHATVAEVVQQDDVLTIVKGPVMMGPPLALAKDVAILDEVIAIGFGWGNLHALVRHVAAFDGPDVIIDEALIHGMSGGPMMDLDGKVVALIQATTEVTGEGCGSGELRRFIEKAKHPKG